MRLLLADLERPWIAIAAAATAIGATSLVRDRPVQPVPLVAHMPVEEEVTTSTRDLPPYVTADLDADGTDEIVMRVEGPRGAEAIVLAREHGSYVPIGRVPLEDGFAPCAGTFTIEDGRLMVTRYGVAPWSAGGCAPASHAYYTVRGGQLAVQDAVLGS